MRRRLTAVLLSTFLLSSPAIAQTGPVTAAPTAAAPGMSELLHKADLSFSPIALGTRTTPESFQLQRGGPTGCEAAECGYADGGYVRHHFAADGTLIAKSFDPADYGYRAIFALSIGSVRRMDDVVANVRAFLPGTKLDCFDAAATTRVPAIAGSPADCFADLQGGTLAVSFNGVGLLSGARIAMTPPK